MNRLFFAFLALGLSTTACGSRTPGEGDLAVSDERLQQMVQAEVVLALEQLRGELSVLIRTSQANDLRVDKLVQTVEILRGELSAQQRALEGFRTDEQLRSRRVAEAVTAIDAFRTQMGARLDAVETGQGAITDRQKRLEADLVRTNAEIRDLNQEMTGSVGYLERIRQAFEQIKEIERDAAEKERQILKDLLQDGR